MNETDQLVSSDTVEHTLVYKGAGDNLGAVYTVMIDKYLSQITYNVMGLGGVLSIGNILTRSPGRRCPVAPA